MAPTSRRTETRSSVIGDALVKLGPRGADEAACPRGSRRVAVSASLAWSRFGVHGVRALGDDKEECSLCNRQNP
jgi:hypothetical protein